MMTFKQQKVRLLQSGAALAFFLDFVPLTQSVFLHLHLSGCLVIRFGLSICGRDSVDVKFGSCHRVPSSGTVSMCPSTGDVYFDHLIIQVELPRFLHCQVTLFLFVFNKGLPGALASVSSVTPLNLATTHPFFICRILALREWHKWDHTVCGLLRWAFYHSPRLLCVSPMYSPLLLRIRRGEGVPVWFKSSV